MFPKSITKKNTDQPPVHPNLLHKGICPLKILKEAATDDASVSLAMSSPGHGLARNRVGKEEVGTGS